MNENSGGMPNPLNPAPGTGPMPSNPLDANPAESTSLEEIVEDIQTINTMPVGTAPTGPAPAQTMGPSMPVGSMPSQPIDPLTRPMTKAPVTQPAEQPKKKTGLIIGAIIFGIIAIGCGVAAALLMLTGGKGDPVANAVHKIVNEEAPENFAIDGTIKLTPNEKVLPITDVVITLNSEGVTKSLINSTKAVVDVNLVDADPISMEFDEVYAANGDLYLRLDGITGAIEDYTKLLEKLNTTETCTYDEEGNEICEEETDPLQTLQTEERTGEDCVGVMEDVTQGTKLDIQKADELTLLRAALGGVMNFVESIDGEWLRISTSELQELGKISNVDTKTTCTVELFGKLNNYNNIITEIYNKNPFVVSTTEDVAVVSESGEPVRKVIFDEKRMDSFFNEFESSSLVSDLNNCINKEQITVSSNTFIDLIQKLPDLYTEVDKDSNFTRLYFETSVGDGLMNLTADLNVSYPANANVAEPTYYKDFVTVFQESMKELYTNDETDPAVVTE